MCRPSVRRGRRSHRRKLVASERPSASSAAVKASSTWVDVSLGETISVSHCWLIQRDLVSQSQKHVSRDQLGVTGLGMVPAGRQLGVHGASRISDDPSGERHTADELQRPPRAVPTGIGLRRERRVSWNLQRGPGGVKSAVRTAAGQSISSRGGIVRLLLVAR
jgi:hypothetical protein